MKILGVSCFFHDSAACLIVDGQIIAAVAEERLSRRKHDNRFPINAIEYCLQAGGLAANELDLITFYEKPFWKFNRLLHQHLQHFPLSLSTFLESGAAWMNQKLNIRQLIKDQLNYRGKVNFIPHHLSHAASCYYTSPFSSAVIVTLDGVGEWATTTIGRGEKSAISIDQEIHFPHSLGLIYSTITSYLGFKVNNDEYKVMGLAAYGNPAPFRTHFEKIIVRHDDGSYSLNMDYFDYSWASHMPSEKLVNLFGHPPRKPESRVYGYHENIAASLQEALEQTIFHLLKQTYQKYKITNLCLAGGVALNSVMNAKILSQTPFKRLYIPPDPSDAGGAMGAALWSTYNTPNFILHRSRRKTILTRPAHLDLAKRFTPYLGPEYQWHQIKRALASFDLTFTEHQDRQKLLDMVATAIKKKKVIGWFQGRTEWGPRALGSRSILAAATSRDMQDILNAKVKHREMFRPFAPVILEEYVPDFFEADKPLPSLTKYMLMVYPFKIAGKKKIPAVVHVDGTGRLQSLARKDNPLYYDLIDTYREKTGIPVIVNTSFNVRGEPIVNSPEDAIRCFLSTEIDWLVIGNCVVKKRSHNH